MPNSEASVSIRLRWQKQSAQKWSLSVLNRASSSPSGIALKTAFAADEKPAAGTALPADGGEPGKAYTTYCKAMTSGDMKALKQLVSADRAKQMDDPDFEKMFPKIQSMMAKGTISTVLEDKQWKVEKDSWTSEMK
jgi:hypothetical protein